MEKTATTQETPHGAAYPDRRDIYKRLLATTPAEMGDLFNRQSRSRLCRLEWGGDCRR